MNSRTGGAWESGEDKWAGLLGCAVPAATLEKFCVRRDNLEKKIKSAFMEA